MKIASKKQLDRAVKAARDVEFLRRRLETATLSDTEWAETAKAYSDAKIDLNKANRVLESIDAFNRRHT